MIVAYAIDGETHTFDTDEDEQLPELIQEIEQHLRDNHSRLADELRLPIVLADGVLNCLADDSDEIRLGELLAEGPND